MRKGVSILLISLALLGFFPPNVMAAPTSRPTLVTSAAKHDLTQAQKDAIAVARSIYVTAKSDALNGFDRATADARAIEDQAIAAASKDKAVINAAKTSYKHFYQMIFQDYKAALRNAKATLINSIATAKAVK